MTAFVRIVSILFLTAILAACGGREHSRSASTAHKPSGSVAAQDHRNDGAGASTKTQAKPNTTEGKAVPITIPPQRQMSEESRGEQTRGSAVSPFSGREGSYLVQDGLSDRQVPISPYIGRLQDRYAANRTTRQQFALVESFLKELSAGKIDDSAFLPSHAAYLEQDLKYDIDEGNLPSSWLIGVIASAQTENSTQASHLRVEFRKAGSVVAGDLFLEKSSEKWYISDIQVDLAQLRTNPNKSPTTRIEPGLPSWMVDASTNGK